MTLAWLAANPEQIVAQTYQNILRLADQLQLHSVAIPALATGIHDLDKKLVAKVALSTHLPQTNYVNRIISVRHKPAMLKVYQAAGYFMPQN
ncbi:MAG TPA: macro domain-containing protein [Psychrobacter pasteurii]|nr:macro domain-containing protein [Psychrobacter pasteurii]